MDEKEIEIKIEKEIEKRVEKLLEKSQKQGFLLISKEIIKKTYIKIVSMTLKSTVLIKYINEIKKQPDFYLKTKKENKEFEKFNKFISACDFYLLELFKTFETF